VRTCAQIIDSSLERTRLRWTCGGLTIDATTTGIVEAGIGFPVSPIGGKV